MTQLEAAKKHIITPLMRRIARVEKIEAELLRKKIARGHIVILRNNKRKFKKTSSRIGPPNTLKGEVLCAVGCGLRTKINANIGTSTDRETLPLEFKKLATAVRYGADAIMDLSIGGNIGKIRKALIAKCDVAFGTVPIYEAASAARQKYGNFLKMTSKDMLDVLERQALDGVDFFTIHSGVTRGAVKLLKKKGRTLDIVSRGGAILAQWMHHNKLENPFYEKYDRVLEIAKRYDIVLSLGDGMRPGAIADASDAVQLKELRTLGKLAKRAYNAGVSVMIEGPGHVPLNQIEKNVRWEKEICNGAPFYCLGPLVTDIAPGYDHITGAIGGALAASYGADFLCYVTPAEHLSHPTVADVREGVIASRIAAHAADIVKNKTAKNKDKEMSDARKKRLWNKQINLSLDPEKARMYRNRLKLKVSGVCAMCGEYCSIKLMEKCMRA